MTRRMQNQQKSTDVVHSSFASPQCAHLAVPLSPSAELWLVSGEHFAVSGWCHVKWDPCSLQADQRKRKHKKAYWCTMVYYGVLWCTILYYGVLMFFSSFKLPPSQFIGSRSHPQQADQQMAADAGGNASNRHRTYLRKKLVRTTLITRSSSSLPALDHLTNKTTQISLI